MPTGAHAIAGFAAVALIVAIVVALHVASGRRSRRRAVQMTGGQTPVANLPPQVLPEHVRDLEHCLEIVAELTQDKDVRRAMAALSLLVAGKIEGRLLKLRKILERLAPRPGQGGSEGAAKPAEGAAPSPESRPAPLEPADAPPQTASAAGPGPSSVAPTLRGPTSPRDARKFSRSPCPGSFKATIYPPSFKPDDEPNQCTVLLRNLSCAGIGIAHSERLHPRQIIIVHVHTKLLIAEVRWCRQVGESSYFAGCQLVKASG